MNSVRGHSPEIDPTVFVASSADIIGDVHVGGHSSIWYQCVLRGDVMPIRIGKNTNIQDGTIIHGTYEKYGVNVGDRVTIGHKVMLHGCSIEDEAFVGMGSIILDGARVASQSFVGAGTLIPQGFETKPGWLYLGQPAKAIRPLKDEEVQFIAQSAKNYMEYTQWYRS